MINNRSKQTVVVRRTKYKSNNMYFIFNVNKRLKKNGRK